MLNLFKKRQIKTISVIDETQVMEAIETLKERNILGYNNCIYCQKEINSESDFYSFFPINDKAYIICSMRCQFNWFHKIMVWNDCGITHIAEKSLPKFEKYLSKLIMEAKN